MLLGITPHTSIETGVCRHYSTNNRLIGCLISSSFQDVTLLYPDSWHLYGCGYCIIMLLFIVIFFVCVCLSNKMIKLFLTLLSLCFINLSVATQV